MAKYILQKDLQFNFKANFQFSSIQNSKYSNLFTELKTMIRFLYSDIDLSSLQNVLLKYDFDLFFFIISRLMK